MKVEVEEKQERFVVVFDGEEGIDFATREEAEAEVARHKKSEEDYAKVKSALLARVGQMARETDRSAAQISEWLDLMLLDVGKEE